MISERPDPKGTWSSPTALVMAAGAGAIRVPSEDDLPQLACKGLCHDQCTVIPMTPVELRKVEQALKGPLEPKHDGTCGALGDDNRCRAYEARPLICKIWGMAEGVMCPHGCETDTGEYLQYHEVAGMIRAKERREGEAIVKMRAEWTG